MSFISQTSSNTKYHCVYTTLEKQQTTIVQMVEGLKTRFTPQAQAYGTANGMRSALQVLIDRTKNLDLTIQGDITSKTIEIGGIKSVISMAQQSFINKLKMVDSPHSDLMNTTEIIEIKNIFSELETTWISKK